MQCCGIEVPVLIILLQELLLFCTAPEIHFDPETYSVSEAGGYVQIRIATNRLDMNGTALFYTEDDTAMG